MKILWKIIKFLITTVLIVVVLLGLLIGGLTAYWAYKENQFNKYNGHGFQYMHGYSSAKSGKTERQFRFIGMPFHFSGTLYYN